MSKKRDLESLRVTSPCTEDWDQMTGNAKVRFCSHCAKDVNNISEMTPKEAVRLARRSGGNICIRYRVDPVTQAPVFAGRLHQIARSPIAATGIVAASIALSSTAYAQGGANAQMPPAQIERAQAPVSCDDSQIEKGRLSGRITDLTGAVVAGVMITLTNTDTNDLQVVSSGEIGEYAFADIPAGSYSLKVEAASGFIEKTVKQISVGGGTDTEMNVELTPSATVADTDGVPLNLQNILEFQLETRPMIMGGAFVISGTHYDNPLTLAVSGDDIDDVRDMIARGDDVNGSEEDGTTPLFVAVSDGNLEIAQTLIDFGAKVNVRNKENRTPLMMMDDDATIDLVNLLIRNNAKINLTDDDGNTALILTAGQVDPEVLQALIDAGADVNLTNNAGQSALMNAADEDRLENVRILLNAGAKVNLRNREDENAWDLTTETEVEQLLEAFGAEVDQPDEDVASNDANEDTAD